MFLTYVASMVEDHGLSTPGRMDQILRPFYEADIAAGRITRADALELICCLYIQINMIVPPGLAVSVIVGGHRYVPGFFCWIMHGELGSRTGATPDGRKAGTAFADGAGAAQGREMAGPTASILSTTNR